MPQDIVMESVHASSSSSAPPPPSSGPLRPPVPSPSATPLEVQNFVAEYLHYVNPHSSRAKVEELAMKVEADGERIYEMTIEQWKNLLQFNGESIYSMLQRSEYGNFSIKAIERKSKRFKNLYISPFLSLGFPKVGRVRTPKPSTSQSLSPSSWELPVSASSKSIVEANPLSDRNVFPTNLKSEMKMPSKISGNCSRYQDSHHSVRSRRTYRVNSFN